MPYISDAKRERERWITLAEAIAHVAEHDGCDRSSALKQLRDALGDRQLHVKWEDQKPIRATLGMVFANWPPDDARSWQEARIRRGQVFDQQTNRWRTLLILKHSIFQLWPVRFDRGSGAAASAAPEGEQSTENGSNVVPITGAKGGRPSAKEDIYQALDELSQEMGRRALNDMSRKELAELVARKCDKQLDESSGPEVAAQRRATGRRSRERQRVRCASQHPAARPHAEKQTAAQRPSPREIRVWANAPGLPRRMSGTLPNRASETCRHGSKISVLTSTPDL